MGFEPTTSSLGIQKLTEEECFAFVQRVQLARLACARDGQPYIIPVYLVLKEIFLYGFTTPGQKIDWMRANPKVCVEWHEQVSLRGSSVPSTGPAQGAHFKPVKKQSENQF